MKRARVPLLCAALAAIACEPARVAETPAPAAVAIDTKRDGPHAAVRRPTTPDAPFRSSAPPEAGPLVFTPPSPHTTTLANGMRVLVVEREVPHAVSCRLVLRGGPAGLANISGATAQAAASSLIYGTSDHAKDDLFDLLRDHLATLTNAFDDDRLTIEVRTVADHFDPVLEILADLAQRATFPADSVERMRLRALGEARHDADDPARAAWRVVPAVVYGASHPYGRGWRARADDLAAMKRDDVVRAYERMFDPADAVLVVAGDVRWDKLFGRVEQLFGAWRSHPGRRPIAAIPPPAPTTKARITIIDRKGSPHAYVVFAGATTPRDARDYPAVVLLNQLWGGMASGELYHSLREKIGATHSVSSGVSPARGASLMHWEASIDAEKLAPTLGEIDRRLRTLREHGPSADDLASAKARFVGGVPASFESTRGITGVFTFVAAYGLPLDEWATWQARLESVNADDVRAAAAAYTDGDRTKVVVGGDFESLRGQLVSLGWGPIDVRDANGALVRTVSP
jgi:zinc protease